MLVTIQAGLFKELPEQLRRLTGFKGGVIRLRNIHKLLVVTMKAHRMSNYELDVQAGVKTKKRSGQKRQSFEELQQKKFDVSWPLLANAAVAAVAAVVTVSAAVAVAAAIAVTVTHDAFTVFFY